MTRLTAVRSVAISLFWLLLFSCGSGSSGSNDNPVEPVSRPLPGIEILDASAEAGDGEVVFDVTLSRAGDNTVRVSYATVDGTATAGTDYEAAHGDLSIPAGALSGTIAVALLDDDVPGDSVAFSIELSNPVNATLVRVVATGTISDADTLMAESVFNPDWGVVGVFTEASNCAQCHRASSDVDPSIPAVMREPRLDSGDDISSAHQRPHTIMAHAFADPYFHAKMADELEIFPGVASTVEDKCLTCHAPMGRTHAHQTGIGLETGGDCALSDGCYRLNAAIDAMHAKAGVSCTVCHQIKPDNLGSADGVSGNYLIADELDPEAFTVFGPYLNPHPGGSNQMLNRSGYAATFGGHVEGSEFCAVCHTLYTGSIDVNSGVPTGNQFLEQAPYLEWQTSDFVSGGPSPATCQDCHQRQAEGDANTTRIAVRPDGSVNEMWTERNPFFIHELVGGNTHVLEMLAAYTDLLGLERSTTALGFAEKIMQTRSFLEERSAHLDIERIEVAGDELHADVRVANRTGHKLPTAYPSRRMWVNLVVRDGSGSTVFESGTPDADGRISVDAKMLAPECLAVSKVVGFDNTPCYEPHRTLITDPEDVAVYEVVMADSNDDVTHVLLHADGLLKDNRLPPVGFTSAAASALEPQIVPVGVQGDTDFNRDGSGEGTGSDLVRYRVDVGGRTGPFAVEARLYYQSIKPSFVQSMHSEAPRVVRFKAMYDAVSPPAEILARDAASL